MPSQSKFWKWTKRTLAALFLLILAAAIAGLIYQSVLSRYEARKYPPPGALINIPIDPNSPTSSNSTRRMHLLCSGPAASVTITPATDAAIKANSAATLGPTGLPASPPPSTTATFNASSPTVILEAGLGDFSLSSWVTVQSDIARFARVCSYDRAGVGWSDPDPAAPNVSRDSDHIAADLDALLTAAKIPGPYVLVGHSIGGFHVRVFAARHHAFSSATNPSATDIAGVILVDSSHPDQIKRMPFLAKQFHQYGIILRLLPPAMYFGYPRFFGICSGDGPHASAELRAALPAIAARQCRPSELRTIDQEFEAFNLDANEAASAGSLGSVPLIVLSSDPDLPAAGLPPDVGAQFHSTWAQLQLDLTHLSTNSSQVIATGSGHYVQRDRPDLLLAALHKLLTTTSHH